jgi:hypothetical protein
MLESLVGGLLCLLISYHGIADFAKYVAFPSNSHDVVTFSGLDLQGDSDIEQGVDMLWRTLS